MEDVTQLVDELINVIQGYTPASPRNVEFATSLVAGKWGYNKRGYLTEKQVYAARKMLDGLSNPHPPDQGPALSKVYEFLKQAKQHLKYPKLVLGMGDDRHLKVYMSGPRSRYPDTINLTTEDEYGSMNVWLGRVFEDGEWQHRKDNPDLHNKALSILTQLAEDPAKVASSSGHMTGNCCFCNRPLTDKRSTKVGYGPVCADRWGLKWGVSNHG